MHTDLWSLDIPYIMSNSQVNPETSPSSNPEQPPASIITKGPRSLFVTLGGTFLLIAGGAVGFWLLGGRDAGKLPVGARVIPQNVVMSLTLSTDTAQWEQLSSLGRANTGQNWQQGVKDLETRLLEPLELSYADHIRPWVGDSLTLAYLAPDVETVEQVDRQEVVWVLPIQNYEQASNLLDSNQLTLGRPPTKRTYNGVEVREFQGPEGQDYAIAVLEQQLMIFSNVSIALNKVIDTVQARKPSIAETPRYQEAMRPILSGQSFAHIFVNLPAAANRMVATGDLQLSEGTLARIKEVQGLGSTVSLESDGLQINGVSWLKPDAEQILEIDNNARDIAKHLPEDTFLMMSGGNFQQLWQDFAAGTPAKLLLPFNPKVWNDDLQEGVGINLNQDFIPWMDGEFAGALVPVQTGEDKDSGKREGVGIALLTKPSDRTAATKAFKTLDDTVQERYDFQISESKVANKIVTTWKVHTGIAVGSHGWLDQSTAFLTLGGPITNRLVQPPKTNLTQSEQFKAVTRSPLRPTSHFYIDMPTSLNLSQNSPLLPKLTPNVVNFLQNFQGIGVTAAINNSWSHRYDIQITFKSD